MKQADPRRCAWPKSELALRYHDREWGVPVKNDRKLFEFLVLDAMQAGLSWEIILRKREGFRAAFDGFDPSEDRPLRSAARCGASGAIRASSAIA